MHVYDSLFHIKRSDPSDGSSCSLLWTRSPLCQSFLEPGAHFLFLSFPPLIIIQLVLVHHGSTHQYPCNSARGICFLCPGEGKVKVNRTENSRLYAAVGAGLRTHLYSLRRDRPTYTYPQKKAGGGAWCRSISGPAALTLRSVNSICDQQDAADMMVNLAKTLHNSTDMIRLAQIFVQQPRNSVCPISSIKNHSYILFIVAGVCF